MCNRDRRAVYCVFFFIPVALIESSITDLTSFSLLSGPLRRVRDPSEAIIDSLERELTIVDSDEEPLVRPSVGRIVIPRLFQTVPSEHCVRVVEASHPGPLHTQLDSTEWRVPASLPTFRRAEEPDSTVPASSRALIAEGQAKPDKSCADREDDDCSSAGSEFCWGEMEDIGDDEVVEWVYRPPPAAQIQELSQSFYRMERGDP